MSPSIACPNCQQAITVAHAKNFKILFVMKCPHCGAKLKETKITPWLILSLLLAVPLFIFLAVNVQNFLAVYFPIIAKVPTIFIFLAFFYPLYRFYENWHAQTLLRKGEIHLR